MGVLVSKCLIYSEIRNIVRLFEIQCEFTLIRRNFRNVSCTTCVFFAFMDYFASNPLGESCHIHLNIGAGGRHCDVYLELL